MSEELIYFPTHEIIKGCSNGDIDVHLPLTIQNQLGDKSYEVLFVDHLLQNCKKEKKPLLRMLSELRKSIKNDTNQLIDSNSFIKHLIDSSIKEWRQDISPYEIFHSEIEEEDEVDEDNLFDFSKINTERENLKDIKRGIGNLEQELQERNTEGNTLDYSDGIDATIRDLYTKSTKCKHRIGDSIQQVDKVRGKIDPKHMKILMDLGMKNKSAYMQFFKESGESPVSFYINDKNSVGIPKNIQTIFTNYSLINNMIHKELDFVKYQLEKLSSVAQENYETMKEFVSGLDTHEHINDYYEGQENHENQEEDDEDEDEAETIKKYIIKEDSQEDSSEDTLMSRLASFFTEKEEPLTKTDKTEIIDMIKDKKEPETASFFEDAGEEDDY